MRCLTEWKDKWEVREQIVKQIYNVIEYIFKIQNTNKLCFCIHGHLYKKIHEKRSRLSRINFIKMFTVITLKK